MRCPSPVDVAWRAKKLRAEDEWAEEVEKGAVVVAQLVQRSLPTPEVRGFKVLSKENNDKRTVTIGTALETTR